MKGELEELIRVEKENVKGIHIFSNINRREIFRELTRFPCRTSSSISRTLGMDVRDAEWHLKKLEANGYLYSWNENGRHYYCVKDLIREEDASFFSSLSKSGMRKIVRYIVYECKELVGFKVKKSTLYRHLNELGNMGMITVIGTRKKMVCPTEKLRNIVDKYDEMGRIFKKVILKKLDVAGYDIEVVGTVNYELKIRVRGIEDFNMGIFISPVRTILEVYE